MFTAGMFNYTECDVILSHGFDSYGHELVIGVLEYKRRMRLISDRFVCL